MADSIDWHRLLWDLLQRGMSIRALAADLELPTNTVRGYMDGSHPPHWKGEMLISMWERCTGGNRKELQTVPVDSYAHRVFSERNAVLASQGVIDSLLQLDFAWFGQGGIAPAESPVEPAPWSVRYRVGVALVPGNDGDQPTPFLVQDERTAALVERSPKFVRWACGWVTLGAVEQEAA
jgi:hypothetical protein